MEYLTFSPLLADGAATSSETAAAAGSQGLVMVLFKAAIAVYLLMGAIRGKGKLIDNQFPKCKPETYRLVLRLICGFAALVILANSVFEFLANPAYSHLLPLTDAQYASVNTVLWVIGLVAMLALIVVNVVLTDRKAMEEARKKHDRERVGANRGDPLRAAFVFDEEEDPGEFARKADGDGEHPNGQA